MFDVMYNDWTVAEREMRLNAPVVRYRREWDTRKHVERLERKLRTARSRLATQPEAA